VSVASHDLHPAYAPVRRRSAGRIRYCEYHQGKARADHAARAL